MFNIHANSARYIYTLSTNSTNINQVKLINGYFFNREPKSDEKLLYTETDIYSFIKTIMTMILFQMFPKQPINEIIYIGEVTFNDAIYEQTDLTFKECIETLDLLFGTGFSKIATKPITKFYHYYKTHLQFAIYGKLCEIPSAKDLISLYRFLNTSNPTYSPATCFIINNSNANKIQLQQKIKKLD